MSVHTKELCLTAIKGMGYSCLAEGINEKPELLTQVHKSIIDHDAAIAFLNSRIFKEVVRKDGGHSGKIDNKGILEFWNNKYPLKNLLMWPDTAEIAVQEDFRMISFVKPSLITEELCVKAITADGRAYKNLPEQFKTTDMLLKAVEKYPWLIEEVPPELLSEEMCLRIAESADHMLKLIPFEKRSKEVCLATAKHKGFSLDLIPEDVLDQEICITAINQFKSHYKIKFEQIPKEFVDYDLCMAAVKADGDYLQFIPKKYLDYDLCLEAAKNHCFCVDKINKRYFTEELCLALVSTSPTIIRDLPKEARTEAVCLLALNREDKKGSIVVEHIPEDVFTQQMADIAISKSVWALEHIPENLVTEEHLISVAKRACARITDNFPERLRNQRVYDRLIAENHEVEKYLQRL